MTNSRHRNRDHSLVSDKCFVNLELCDILQFIHSCVHLYYRPQINSIHVFKKKNSGEDCENENASLESFCQVMFYCCHFYFVRIEPHCRHRSTEVLIMQTDQSKRDILIDYVLMIYLSDYLSGS